MNKKTYCTDEMLVGLAQAGDDNAYNALLERYDNKIRQIVLFNINDPSSVNDLAQEVLFKVYRFLPYFKAGSQFSTWLYRMTQNTIKNHYRTMNLRLESESQFASDQSHQLSASPESLLMNMEFNEKIDRALSKLSYELQACYGMHTFEGQSYEDIAKELDCPIGTVRSRIFRARKLLIHSMSGF